jgi:molybdate transport system substrate-binding protein
MKRPLAAIMVAPILIACGSASPEPPDRVVVLAAASLTDALEELAGTYVDETGTEIVISFDASSALRAQIEEGAQADLFVSADVANPQQLVDAGLTDGEARRFASNALTIVVPADGSSHVAAWTDLAAPAVRIVAAGDDVPITRYAVELIDNLAAQPGAPSGFADAYAGNIVSREDNVRAVLAKIELGEGDAGIVYETDAASSIDVTTIDIPAETNVAADYAFVVLADAPPGAAAFGEWLLGEEAQSILASHGFRPPNG